jgi:hypothetical protein
MIFAGAMHLHETLGVQIIFQSRTAWIKNQTAANASPLQVFS